VRSFLSNFRDCIQTSWVPDRCGRSSYFDREEFNEARNLRCPLDGCTYAWCKGCQQEIVPGGPEHSCDGSSELKHLVQQQGWKFCPSKFAYRFSGPRQMLRDDIYASVQHAMRKDFRVQLSICKSDTMRRVT
jgi:hypothetical protein